MAALIRFPSRIGSVTNRLTSVNDDFTLPSAVESFRHEGLRELFETGKSRRVRTDLQKRCIRVMDALDAARSLLDLDVPGLGLHPLKGERTGRHALSVSGAWRITFAWQDKRARELDLEQYH